MSLNTHESDNRMVPKEPISSPSLVEAHSGRYLALEEKVLKKGPWTSAEDSILVDYVKKHGEGNWNAVQKNTGLLRCGKSCRLRWANHLRPNLKKGAFTDEEEQKIVELHAQMGNKWARMAAYLPGRTDNEIKNYWNTRIKRRQRAGLPLYPSDLCIRTPEESQQGFSDLGNNVKAHNDLLQGKYDFSLPMFDLFNVHQGSTLLRGPCSDITSSNLLYQGFEQHGLGHMSSTFYHMKRFRDSEASFPSLPSSIYRGFPKHQRFSEEPFDKIHPGYGGGFYPFDSNPGVKCLVPVASHALSNGNFSASCPFPGVVKTELPSLQFAETDLISLPSSSSLVCAVDGFTPSSMEQSDCCASPGNNGLLESLLYEAQSLGLENNQPFSPSDMLQSSTPVTELEEYSGYISPLGSSTPSAIHDWTPLEDLSPINLVSGSLGTTEACGHVSEARTKELDYVASPQTDFSGPDALLDFDWSQESSQAGKDQSNLNDVISAFLGSSTSEETDESPAAMAATLARGIGLEDLPWTNMPRACQMP